MRRQFKPVMPGLSGTFWKMRDETVPRQMPAGRRESQSSSSSSRRRRAWRLAVALVPAALHGKSTFEREVDAPKAVQVCHCIARRPRILAGAISEAKTGTVALFGPIPMPRNSREMKRCHQVFVTAPCARGRGVSGSLERPSERVRARGQGRAGDERRTQMQPRPAQRVEMKMAPRRPKYLLSG